MPCICSSAVNPNPDKRCPRSSVCASAKPHKHTKHCNHKCHLYNEGKERGGCIDC